MEDLSLLGGHAVLRGVADVSAHREAFRRRRLRDIAIVLGIVAAVLLWGLVSGDPFTLGWPDIELSPEMQQLVPGVILILVLSLVLIIPLATAGRSPHVMYRPSEIPVTLDDVVGLGAVREEVVKTLNLFLAFRTFRDRMGGNPRRAILFEGPPGTGKTYMAKAMAREAGVPFLFVSASAFQSMYYGQTNRKIRSFFRKLRATARREGGAIGFIEEIDAIAAARSGMRSRSTGGGAGVERSTMSEGISGVVNELLVQMQSFDEPTLGSRLRGGLVDAVNRFLPDARQLSK
ncbi:MAG: AAA family ATPase, partial [Planctomycetota bacterium]